MRIILFDQPNIRMDLLPFTFTRPIADLRVGILTIAEKWSKHFHCDISYQTETYLTGKYPLVADDENLLINGALLPDLALVTAIESLKSDEALSRNGLLLAVKCNKEASENWPFEKADFKQIEYQNEVSAILKPWHIFQLNGQEIRKDFALLTHGRKSQTITDPHVIMYGKENIFIEDGAKIKACIINAEEGPVYIGRNAQIHEGVMIHGPLALCESAHLNMGAKLRGDNTIGPFCKAGGEVSNSVMLGYSNKGHDGFLGNSVIGEWCNIGADTNTSNLKNNYTSVKLWSYSSRRFEQTGQQFCGLMLGDHSKCGINTMFNTGTVVGVGANIFGAGFPRNFIPSFAWGGVGTITTYRIESFFETADAMMGRRGLGLSEVDREIYHYIFAQTQESRA
jgi:UDP-N-acetylglucosamine diphosphorylase/glucosamine-1-phosphate N-acetyltransferase